ncbi:hypothetical protein STENM223S_09394 [Streptomyces tendae]
MRPPACARASRPSRSGQRPAPPPARSRAAASAPFVRPGRSSSSRRPPRASGIPRVVRRDGPPGRRGRRGRGLRQAPRRPGAVGRGRRAPAQWRLRSAENPGEPGGACWPRRPWRWPRWTPAGRRPLTTAAEPSPFARSLLFGYVAQFLYEGDSPLAERRAAALSLDSRLLAELLGQAELRELLDAEVLTELERELQWLTEDRRIKDAERCRRPASGAGSADGRGAGRAGRRAAVGTGAGPGPPCDQGADRRHRPLGGDRGRGPVARRARHGAARRCAGGLHRAGQGSARRPPGPPCPHPRPFHIGHRGGPLRSGRGGHRGRPAAARRVGAGGAGRVPSGRDRPGVVRRDRAAQAAPPFPGRAPARAGAGGAGRARPVPPPVAAHRQGTRAARHRRPGPRGRAAAGRLRARLRAGEAGPPRPRGRLLPRDAGRADGRR